MDANTILVAVLWGALGVTVAALAAGMVHDYWTRTKRPGSHPRWK